YLKKYSPNLIISFKTKPNIYAIIVAKYLKIPIIICEHGFHAGEKSIKTNKLRKKYYPKSNLLTVLTNADYKYYDFVKNKTLIPNPIDIISLGENNIKKENIILYVGRLEPEKSVDIFIKAISKIKNINQWKIQIAGDGSLKEELIELSKIYKLNIEFLGHVKNLHELYLKSKILCLTSEQEGLPIVLLESIIYNCVRISSNYIGVEELIVDNYNGLIFKKGNYLDLADKINLIQENDQLYHNLTLNAKKILSNFDKKTIFKKWDLLIQNTVKRDCK
ncbi:glycosyltransferase family 4 protein, partial [Campylobacter lari]|nr:glycosyltransferase family 4 protein [Campylobacter lari]